MIKLSPKLRDKIIELNFKIKKPVLALGPEVKNTVCFARGNLAFISRVHADLSNPIGLLDFEQDAAYFLKKKPKVIACDLHPDYQSSKYIASALGIQHHHAHIASCMAENGLKNRKVIGVAFDGTGLGSDGTLWGGEFLACDYRNYKRLAHLKEIPLVGGERAILEPWRLVAAWFNFSPKLDKGGLLKKIFSAGINSPLDSSMGRLFDAAGSLILGRRKANFEAELAMELEKKAREYGGKGTEYGFEIKKENGIYIIDPLKMFKQIVLDLRHKEQKEKLAFRFHLTAANMIKKICAALRKETGINITALSGGVFQNKLLLKLSLDLLYKEGFNVLTHRKLSCNDSGISLGQAVIAGARINSRK
ncbi:MAG: hypothetical protein COT38_01785 [Candidatus Omnitrophica bacterium CG08_land_8_20_14_0_20_41_16]|uniref:Uncharacterized protein n=1 Tax=Candidatus Sherwoodlollariibacterium unditelluris TaxID=1974757 RepID=A0A2G9YJ32_9BACT|nr:MAG: hypothetical protein COX41_03915 [Candidatus Omnitrophica bacterium CG23_combo_of_CG06-09_8_20_14_all_41_10]PIS34080.1 MAG: hypothetical protein COT38_01785 [Candidatus Omnitrophica bacterium CG08_land_8_20_14_0_20_41_16]